MLRHNAQTYAAMLAAMLIIGGQVVQAGQASTHAAAGSGYRGRSGTAAASANYDGNGGRGFTHTATRTGNVNMARGLAIGFDDDGMDLSYSYAVAPNHGPAYAGTMNVSIGHDGGVSGSQGAVSARGGAVRSVQAGGSTSSGRYGRPAVATASGRTLGGGRVIARTHASADRSFGRSYRRSAHGHRLIRSTGDGRRYVERRGVFRR